MIYDFITKQHFIDILNEFGIKKGDLICLQANLYKLGNVIEGYKALIDACLEVVGQQGCVMMPSFTYSCFDPACLSSRTYKYESWQDVRDNMEGYHSKCTLSEVYTDCANQMMTYSYKRSNHPVYSFIYIGNYEEKWVKQQMNYPISFSHALNGFVKRNAYNIIIGDELLNSVLIPAIGKTMNAGITKVERAYISGTNKKTLKTYLNLELSEDVKMKLLDMCILKNKKINGEPIYCISIVDNK